MATKIPWTDETWNFLGGCSPVGEGCLNCAAARSAQLCVNRGNKKYEGLVKNGKWTGEVRLFPSELEKPLHWRKERMIFPAFMGDLFHEAVPVEFIREVFEIMINCPQHIFQILTKRPKRALAICGWLKNIPNLWLGVSCENQRTADEQISILVQIAAAVRFVSAEPLLEAIDFQPYCDDIDWFVLGCESGPKRRHISLDDFRRTLYSIDSQSTVFVKQVSINGKVNRNPEEWPEEFRIRQFPKGGER